MDSKLHKAEKPTPEEFIKYIIKTAKSIGPYALDNHIKPIWASCPFCSVEFDIVGHLEDFSKDSNVKSCLHSCQHGPDGSFNYLPTTFEFRVV